MCAIQTQARIHTDRLILRPPGRKDAAWIAEHIGDYDIARMLARVPHPYAMADAESFIDGLGPRDRVFLIEHREHGPVGVLGFHDGVTRFSETGCALGPEVGYWLAKPHWGEGLASEAVQAALVWASEEWGVRAASSGHFVDNPASARVLEKAGFLYTGEVQHRFSLARGEAAATRMMVWLA